MKFFFDRRVGKSKEAWARPELKSISPRENSLSTTAAVDIVGLFNHLIFLLSLPAG